MRHLTTFRPTETRRKRQRQGTDEIQEASETDSGTDKSNLLNGGDGGIMSS